MYIIGLTGGIASGKSTVSKFLREQGVKIVDADEISRNLLQPGSSVLETVLTTFDASSLLVNGELDRQKLAEIVFSDQKKLECLNSLIHPVVFSETEEKLNDYKNAGEKIAVIDAPLLLEAGLDKIADEVWVVAISEAEQIKRCQLRDGFDEVTIKKRIRSQMPLSEKIKRADKIINNSGSVDETYKIVNRALLDIKEKISREKR